MNYDIAIIGNGIISYVTAYSLLQEDPGLKIAIIGKKNRYGSGTIAAGAMLNVFAEVTNRTLSSAAAKTKFEMAIQASKLWKNWINELNENFPLHKKLKIDQGTFVILNARSGRLDCENYQAIIDTLKFYQEPYTEIKASDIPGLNSLEDARPLNSLYIPNEGCISSLEMLEALENILSSYHNVMLVDDVATEIQYISGATNGVKTLNKGVFSTRQVILAAGVYSQQLIDQIPEIKDNIPRILSGVGYSLLIKEHSTPIQHAIRTPNRAGACGLHALPRGDSTLYIGATNNIQVDPQLVPTAGLIKFLLNCAIEQIDQDIYKSQLFGWHVGNRPVPIDTFPLIGETSIKGLWMLTGTYRDGFLQSPLLGQNIAAQILGKPGILNNNEIFLPERSLIQTMSKEESIQEYLLHYLSGCYEHKIKLPNFLSEDKFRKFIEDQAQKVYEKLGTNFGLSSEMMIMFFFDSNPEQRIAYFKDYFSKIKYKSLAPQE